MSMLEVIGYEGRCEGYALSWGSAAVLEDGIKLINAVSGLGRSQTRAEIQALAASGALTLLPQAVPVEAPCDGCVLETTPYARLNLEIPVLSSDYITVKGPQSEFHVFRRSVVFDAFRERTANLLCLRLLFDGLVPTTATQALHLGLALSAHHPILNALRAQQCPEEEYGWAMAEAMLRSDEARKRFFRAKKFLTQKR